MQEQLNSIWERVSGELANINDSAALDQLRVRVLGKKGELTEILRGMGKLPTEERPKMGQLVNAMRERLENAIAERSAAIKTAEKEAALKREVIDVTLPVKDRQAGSLHPISMVLNDLLDIFIGLGFESVEGPEIEFDHFNFELLNVPKNHPARDAQDTFYIDDNIVLRSQTSPVQARVMTTTQPPIRIVSPGRVYRADEVDATHSPVFHQFEGLCIDENITMADLKGCLDEFAKRLFGENARRTPGADPESDLNAANPVAGMRYLVMGGGSDGFGPKQWAVCDRRLMKQLVNIVYNTRPTVMESPQDNPLKDLYTAYADFGVGWGDARMIIFGNPN